MASLIAVRQALKFRQVTVEIPGNPAIQIDDQIVVRERVTGTNHLFYVSGLTNTYDAITGRYTYTLQLQWLGTPARLMTVNDIQMADNAKAYLQAIGAI